MATLEGREPISNIKGIATADNSLYLLSDRIASLNFDGFIPRDNTLVYASDLTPGQTVFTSDPTARDNSLFITRIDTKTVTVESVEETSYFLYYLGDNDLESPYTYGATNVDGSFSQNHLFNVYVDDISDVALGTTGWMMTNQGNAVFSNVFVRGTIEATSGQIDGILKVGESSEGDPLVTIGKNIFSSTPFEGSSGEHSGLFLNKNNYLLGYNVPTNIPITSIVVSDSTGTDYLRKATFTLAGHTLALNDLVSISGFDDDKFIELDNVFPVKEITTDTFTIYYKNPISGTTNPISANLKAESFALNNIYDITSFSLSETTSSTTTSSVNVYLDTNFITLFLQGQVTNLNSIVNSSLLAANGVHKIVSVTNLTDQDNSYFTITTRRIAAGTYTTDLGQITLFNSNYKFKVGDSDNSMSYNSFTGALTVTGRINANSGNFTNTVSIGEPNIFYSVSNKQLLNNEAILTTSTPHSFVVGDSVTIIGVDSTFNGTYSVTSVPTEETFIYSKTATNVSSTAVSPVGTVSRGAPVDGTLLVGYGSNQITINGTGLDSTSAIYAGAGNYGETDTGFFMDASGRFSLKDKLKFTSAGDLTVSGTINASAGNFTGFVTAGNMKIGKDVESTNDGVYINSTNYWYDDGKFSLGSGTKKIYFDGTDVKITSDVIIEGGLTTTSLTVGTSPNQMIMSPTAIPGGSGSPGLYMSKTGDFINATTGDFSLGDGGISWNTAASKLTVNGILSGYVTTDIVAVAASDRMAIGYFNAVSGGAPSGVGLKLDENNYWFVGDKFKLGNSTKNVTWNGTDLSVTGTIKATEGYIGGTTSGWAISSSTLSNGIVGLFAPDVKNGAVTANGTIQPANSTTLVTSSATIEPKVGMSINNIEVFDIGTYITAVSGSDPTYTITVSSGAKVSHFDKTFTLAEYAIYAGNSTRRLAPFKVDYLGNVIASNANITGNINATSGSFTNTVYVGNNATASNNIQLIGTATAATTAIGIGSGTLGYNTTTTKFWADASGRFSLGQGLLWDGTNLTINGSGTFSGSLSAATGTFSGSLSAATGTFSGSLSAATGTFSGSLSAATGSFTGSVTATSGTIGGWSISSSALTTEASNIGFKTNSTGKSIVKTGNAAALSTTITLNNTTGLSAGMVVSVSGTVGLTYTPAATVIVTVVNSTQIVVSKPTFIAITNLNITFWYPYIWSGGTIGTSSSTGMAGFQVYGNGTIMVNDIAVQPGSLDVAFNSGISTNTGTGSDIGITLIKRPYTTTSTNNFYLACYNGTSYIGGILDGAGNGVLTYATFLGTHYSEISPYYDYSSIPLGTVLESVDDLVEIKFTQQERLPKAKISDTYGSKKVYGVFMGIDDSQDENRDYLPDGIHVASVGAGWVRISESAIVFNGDLLISNGDGTAVAQEDDLIRSSTIGKVTSGTKTKIYEDGSYLVPAVLYCG